MILVSLLILNLFVAMILTTTEEIAKIEELSVNSYQLFEIRTLWKQFDKDGTGFIDYKQFWQFASKIALIFNVNPNELLDVGNKKKFLKSLQLPVYENGETRIFCYKFYDVVISLAKVSVILKYGARE